MNQSLTRRNAICFGAAVSALTALPALADTTPSPSGLPLKDLAAALSATGNRHVQLRLYPQARHELLNETNRDEVCADILGWLEQALALGRPARSE